ncbi:Frataxin [Trametes maxima]|nr:Frataxin [Trametes maxima]
MSLRQTPRIVKLAFTVTKRVPFAGTPRALHLLSQQQWAGPLGSTMACRRRHLATPPPQVNDSDLSSELYHRYADRVMNTMLEALEELLDDVGDPEYEVEYSSGVLTLKLGRDGTYVINKQPPNKQIWLSSPFSGPKRYDYDPAIDEWVYYRDGDTLNQTLNRELSHALERDVDLGLTGLSS